MGKWRQNNGLDRKPNHSPMVIEVPHNVFNSFDVKLHFSFRTTCVQLMGNATAKETGILQMTSSPVILPRVRHLGPVAKVQWNYRLDLACLQAVLVALVCNLPSLRLELPYIERAPGYRFSWRWPETFGQQNNGAWWYMCTSGGGSEWRKLWLCRGDYVTIMLV